MPVTFEEKLPFPFVQYPCGAFIGFKQTEDSEYFLCSCNYEAVLNYIKIHIRYDSPDILRYNEINKIHLLNSWDFPSSVTKNAIKNELKQDETIINYIDFKDKLCHRCNKQIPLPTACHPMYGGRFKQKFGWYILVKYYENALEPRGLRYLPELCSDDILCLVNFRFIDLFNVFREYDEISHISDEELLKILNKLDETYELGKNRFYGYPESTYNLNNVYFKVLNKQKNKINRFIEDQIRLEFNVNKIGDKWSSETILANIIYRLFPDEIIIRHYRPKILNNLELDIYIQNMSIGIEYQGIQHYKAIKHWGGESGLKKRKENDRIKKILCKKNNIKLIYFRYDEELSTEFVYNRIKMP